MKLNDFSRPILIFLYLTTVLHAQSSSPSTPTLSHFDFERIGLTDGLPSEYVNCIAQDRFGFMWFGTKNGLCRYDGRKFKTYKTIDGDSTSLPGNDIQSLFSDAVGRLWVGAYDLHLYNFEQDSFTRIAPPRYAALANKLKYVARICEDNAGNLWLGTFGQGLFKFHPASGELAHIELGSQAPKLSIIYSLFTEGADTLWVASTNHQLTILNTRTSRQQHYFLKQKGDVQRLLRDFAGRLWLGAMGEPLQRMELLANGDTAFTRFEHIKPGSFFACFAEDRNGNLWIGTQQEGLYVFNPSRNETQHYRQNSRAPHNLPGNDVQEIFEDRSGNIWVATDKGVAKWARWKKPFRHFQHDTENPNSLNAAEVTGIKQDANGDLWISTLNTGFCKLNLRTGIFTRYDPSTCRIRSPWAIEILPARGGVVWIATNFQHGLNRFEIASGKIQEYRNNPADTTSLSSNFVSTLFEDREGRIWASAANRGLNLYDSRTDGFQRFQHSPNEAATLSHNNVLSIYQDETSTLWVGTSNGLNRFDPPTRSFTRYFPSAGANAPAKPFEVYALHEDSRSRFWLGANHGLYLFDRQNGALARFAELSELSGGKIFSIAADGAGRLWLQTATAIAQFDPQTRTTRIYDRNDGWLQNAVNEREWMHAAEKLNSGELVYGGANGITIFHPDSVKDNPYAPAVHITGFNLSYQPVDVSKNPQGRRAKGDSLLTRALLLTGHLALKHSERTFSFEFAALDYTQPEANQYAFMLEGFHDDWVYGGNERTATFTNVPPGEYTFRVKGANNDGLWNETGDQIRLTILPPWWQTQWAYALYVLLLGLAFYGVRRFEMNRLQMRHQLKMKEFETKHLQEGDHLKSRFFANISHEFRTPLTLILGPLEEMIAKIKDKAVKGDLRVMERNAQRLLRLINQLLDLSRLESGGMTLHASRGDFIAFLKGIVMSFASLAEQKKSSLQFINDATSTNGLIVESYFDRDKIEKIFYNLLSNAFKFTPAGGSIEVAVGSSSGSQRRENPTLPATATASATVTANFIEVTIKDTGIGIPQNRLPYIFDRFYQVDNTSTREYEGTGIGLALTKELVERHYGEIAVQSEEGKGSEFVVRLPMGKEHLKPEEIVEISEQLSVFSDQSSVISDRASGK